MRQPMGHARDILGTVPVPVSEGARPKSKDIGPEFGNTGEFS